jgi:hypothetical protein
MHTPEHLASGFPSANIDQKITTLGQPLAASANINQQAKMLQHTHRHKMRG